MHDVQGNFFCLRTLCMQLLLQLAPETVKVISLDQLSGYCI